MVYHLNFKWKLLIVGSGVVSCVLGLSFLLVLGTLVIITPDADGNVWFPIIISLAFLLMGAEQIFEGSKTKIVLSKDGIVYHQPRYVFSARWADLQTIIPSPGTLVLRFSDIRLIRGGVLYWFAKLLGMHQTLAINYFSNRENLKFIKDRIVEAKGLHDRAKIRSLERLLGLIRPSDGMWGQH